MSEYISKKNVREIILNQPSRYDMLENVKSAPSADVRENIHATWEEISDPIDSKYGKHNYVCPKCFRDPLYFVGGTEDWWCIDKPHFCPNCGADMREPIGEKGTE